MLHIASQTSLSWYWLWHPLSGPGYQFWSGLGSDLSEITLLGLALGAWRHVNCHAPWCFRLGKHPTADGQHKLCRRHHPDLPDRAPSLATIQARHRAAKPKRRTPRA